MEIDEGRPIQYRGSGPAGGHSFVLDGYQGADNNYFHFNWGWGGYADGYFYVSNLNPGSYTWNDYQGAIIGIEPNGGGTNDFSPPENLVISESAFASWDPPTQSEWLLYDIDNQGFGGIGAEAADYSIIWASKFVPDQLTDYAPGYVTKVAVSQVAPVGDYVTEVRVMSGDGTNVLYVQDVTGTLVEGWNEIVLNEAVPFDNTENLWIAMYAERPGGTFNEPTSSVDVVYSDRYDYFAYNGAPWTQINTEYGFTDQAWMLRAFVSTSTTGKSVAIGKGDFESIDYKDFSQATRIPTGIGMVEMGFAGQEFPDGAIKSKEVPISYNISLDGTLVGNTTETSWQYTGVTPGEVYSAGVSAVYSEGESYAITKEFTVINCELFNGPEDLEAYNLAGTDDVFIEWAGIFSGDNLYEDFEGGALPGGWSTQTNSSDGWFFTNDGSSSYWTIPAGEGSYACSNDDAANDDGSVDYLITPEMSFVGLSDLQLTFSSFLDGAYGYSGAIEVTMDGGITWEVVENVATAAAWTEVQVDLSAYAGAESIRVAFHSNDNGSWASGWAIDNVAIQSSKADKTFPVTTGVNVYRDGDMIAFVPVPETSYIDMNLQAGNYDYCVTKVYEYGGETWFSCEGDDCVNDVFVSDCEFFNGPEGLEAYNLGGTDDVVVLWGGEDLGEETEFRYDDGNFTGQLGFNGGTTSSVLGK